MASAMKAKIMETLPIENRSRSDIALPCCHIWRAGQREGSAWKPKCAPRSKTGRQAEPGRGGRQAARATRR